MNTGGTTRTGYRLGFLTATGVACGAIALAAIAGWLLLGGASLFNPGGLNANVKGRTLGGVASHAGLGADCTACHTAPWESATMADRCMRCHPDVITQVQGHSGLHGGLVGAMSAPTCRACHSEHHGPDGQLTVNFDHSRLSFKLIGKHASVPCDRCHTAVGSVSDFRNTPHTCVACHAKDDKHAGSFGQQCEQCHNPTGWANATFDHTIFPVTHGRQERVAVCATCHPDGVKTYTCFGCHQHTPANVVGEHEGRSLASLTNCITCHVGGRGGD